MHLVPVLDIAAGVAVHARGGRRRQYAPVRSALLPDAPGDALGLARAFRERLGASRCYVADLDAIQGREPQRTLLRRLASGEGFGAGLLVDAGISDPERARAIVADGAAGVVVGLETLPSFQALGAIVAAVGAERVVFGLDLRRGTPLGTAAAGRSALSVVELAVAAGARALLVLDLERVGLECGVDLELVAAVRARHPGVSLLAGGGIRGREELQQLARLGCEGALVATALHSGRLGRADLLALR
ncbi:MAG TPA: HisA/HisF-related TIM barrel protein [Gemmatimonadales bacterium]|nr:HisA/HisF-related TIM barrel protein [Gemmatimonadales bacterium]